MCNLHLQHPEPGCGHLGLVAGQLQAADQHHPRLFRQVEPIHAYACRPSQKLRQLLSTQTHLPEDRSKSSLGQIFLMKGNHNPSFCLLMVVNMVAPFNPVQFESILLNNPDDFPRLKGRQFRHDHPRLGYTRKSPPPLVSFLHALSNFPGITRSLPWPSRWRAQCYPHT